MDGYIIYCKIKVAEMCKIFMQMVMQWGFTWRGSRDNLFGFAKSVTAGRLAKENHGCRGSMSSP
ncbi:hypothetical protein GsuE55_25270 [Geobacillus subterraneus]|uniref:Uncharacterized protein n=1 Tax=Geobacillus subterraneus TaxID=129338 RepID=A0A679FY03_9BACL|nr:hypothetical protein GsuE55_25270 [Geobacillus subterraneus]